MTIPTPPDMRLLAISLAALAIINGSHGQRPSATQVRRSKTAGLPGFDRNEYPGDATLPTLRRHFSFTGYWLNNPPGEQQDSWTGKRNILRQNGFGFLVLFNGRLDSEILKIQRSGTIPSALGQKDAASAISAAKREHFPPNTIVFLDQEEGGRLLPEQSAYVLAWTEAISQSWYRAGVYASGQRVNESHGQTITTAEDIRTQVTARHLHLVTFFIYQDACPPSNGCSLHPPPVSASGTPDVLAWQYAQSPRRPETTHACARTYAADGNCYAPDLPKLSLDLSVSTSADPSHGR